MNINQNQDYNPSVSNTNLNLSNDVASKHKHMGHTSTGTTIFQVVKTPSLIKKENFEPPSPWGLGWGESEDDSSGSVSEPFQNSAAASASAASSSAELISDKGELEDDGWENISPDIGLSSDIDLSDSSWEMVNLLKEDKEENSIKSDKHKQVDVLNKDAEDYLNRALELRKEEHQDRGEVDNLMQVVDCLCLALEQFKAAIIAEEGGDQETMVEHEKVGSIFKGAAELAKQTIISQTRISPNSAMLKKNQEVNSLLEQEPSGSDQLESISFSMASSSFAEAAKLFAKAIAARGNSDGKQVSRFKLNARLLMEQGKEQLSKANELRMLDLRKNLK